MTLESRIRLLRRVREVGLVGAITLGIIWATLLAPAPTTTTTGTDFYCGIGTIVCAATSMCCIAFSKVMEETQDIRDDTNFIKASRHRLKGQAGQAQGQRRQQLEQAVQGRDQAHKNKRLTQEKLIKYRAYRETMEADHVQAQAKLCEATTLYNSTLIEHAEMVRARDEKLAEHYECLSFLRSLQVAYDG